MLASWRCASARPCALPLPGVLHGTVEYSHGPTLPRPMVHQGRRGGTPGASVLVGGCALCAALPVVAVSVRHLRVLAQTDARALRR